MHFHNYTHGECRFCDLTVPYCQGFLDYLLSDACMHNGKRMMGTTANNNLTKLKCIPCHRIRGRTAQREYRQETCACQGSWQQAAVPHQGKLLQLSQTPCKGDVLRRAGLFSLPTGLRLSDCIRLQWENIVKLADGGWEWTLSQRRLPPLQSCLSAKRLCSSVASEGHWTGVQESHEQYSGIVSQTVDKGFRHRETHHTFHCFRHTLPPCSWQRNGHLHRE